MLALAIAILAAVLLTPFSRAQSDSYTVLSTVIFVRSGDRTPKILGDVPTTLTSLGAQQAYAAGSFYRDRYVSSAVSKSGVDKAPLHGLSANSVDPRELYILALDTHPTVATAQAFMQGFYPPLILNQSTAGMLDPASILANNTYIESPLNGYQYPQIHTADEVDLEFIFLSGQLNCPAFRLSTIDYAISPECNDIQADSKSFYQSVGGNLLDNIIQEYSQDYMNAYAIYDYLNYQATHNSSVAAIVNEPEQGSSTNETDLDRLRFFADMQQFALLGNKTARNNFTTPSTGLPGGVEGSISTIAGNLLLDKVLNQLQNAIETRGEYFKFSLLVADFEPLISLFALAGLSDLNSNKFRGIPDFASTAVFELFTFASSPEFPASTDDLWVRFYFRNGTEQQEDEILYQSYPLFSHGPSETDLRWRDFQSEASALAMSQVGDWCEACAATAIFCPAFNASLFEAADASSTGGKSSDRAHALSPSVSGVLGAIIALVVAGVIFALAMVIGGIRLHRKKTLQAGGFRGTAKMTPDRDVEVSGGGGQGLSKNGAVVAGREAPTEGEVGGPVAGGHERVGSWEMKEPGGAGALPVGNDHISRASFEDDGDEDYRRTVDPFADPVKPHERV